MKWLTLFLLISLIPILHAQEITFQHIGTNEGLSQNSVSSIVQDSTERMWIGTRDGLNIFDGTSFKTLRPLRGDSTSLLGHFITKIVKEDQFLWVITKNGLSRLDIKTLKFKQFPVGNCNSVLPYRNKILVGLKDGLFELDTTLRSFEPCREIFDAANSVQCLYSDQSGLLWLGTNTGLYLYSPHKKGYYKLLEKNTMTVFTDSQKRTWVGTYNNGVYLFDNQQMLLKHFFHDKQDNTTLINDVVRDINEDIHGNIWIGTFMGLSLIHGTSLEIRNYSQSTGQQSISHNSILSICRDHQGSMWLGTYFGGISYYNSDFSLYRQYPTYQENHELGLGFKVISEMVEDADKNLWIGTDGGGVDCYNRQTQTFRHYPLNQASQGLVQCNVKALHFIDKKRLMIGTHLGGLIILDIETGNYKTYLPDITSKYAIASNIIEDIIPFGNMILLGTKEGVISFDPVTERFSDYIIDPTTQKPFNKRIICLFEDSFGLLWIGTLEQGLYAYNKEKNELKAYRTSSNDLSTISSDNISCIYEDHYFRLWFGTHGGGLNLYNREHDNFSCLNMNNSNLPNDFIQGIKKSRLGNIWISTIRGISILEVEKNHFINFSRQNGFPLSELNHRALYVTNIGEVFVGGIDGLVSFKEQELIRRSNNFKLIFTGLSVNGNEIVPGDASRILNSDLPYTSSIRLKANQNNFILNYSACNYISNNLSSFRYKLENYHERWMNAGNQTNASFSKLPPGKYTFRIQTLSNDESTVIDEKQLAIVVTPPFFKTIYAYALYLLFIAGIFLWFYNLRRNKQIVANRLKLEQLEKEQIKQLNQSKLAFFTSISHEFRTPLTLITGSLEAILENPQTTAWNHQLIRKTMYNVNRLNNLINELLDFRKMESGHIKLKISPVNPVEFLETIYRSFSEHAQLRNIKYDFHPHIGNERLWIDSKQMEKVFYNLISNAFKFTQDNTGQIRVEIFEDEKNVNILIRDNGIGIPSDELENIFNLYHQVDNLNQSRNHLGSGIGLALSKNIIKEHLGAISVISNDVDGTVFKVSLLKGRTHFGDQQINDEQTITITQRKEDAPVLSVVPRLENNQVNENAPLLLIVEDNLEVQNLLTGIFEVNYRILTAENGKEGMELAIKEQPDLILSDVMMPVMTGTEMCTILKRNIDTSHIPIVILTAKASDKYQIEGLETGADDYISKPFHTKLLQTRIWNILHNRMLLQQKYSKDPHLKAREITTNTIDQQTLEQAEKIILKHLDNAEFSIVDFANEMNLSRSKLFKKIKGITGQTPNDLILSTRLKKAAQMLTDPENDLTVSEVAYEVGYRDPHYFSKSFRSHFGVSPTKYGTNNLKK